MKTLYFDCGMGAAGDMITASLLELVSDGDAFIQKLNSLGVPGVEFSKEYSVKCGIKGTHVNVVVNGEEEESIDVTKTFDHTHGYNLDHEHTHAYEATHEIYHDNENGHMHDHAHNHYDENAEASLQDHNKVTLPEHDKEQSHTITHNHTHVHRSMKDIEEIVNSIPLTRKVKNDILSIYHIIAEAESAVHGVPVDEIHFHEVGSLDAVADVAAVCMLMEEINPDRVVVSPIHVGSGKVRCAHGILPVPAPATAYILKEAPIYSGEIKGELCTPTGAAILKYFADSFGNMPVMRDYSIGYGMGKKDFPAANCIRAFLGETESQGSRIFEISCNVDDMTGEQIGFAMDRIFDAGAVEVYTTSVGMKKCRPGVLITALCHESAKESVIRAIFTHTTTIGIRENSFLRHTLERSFDTVKTSYGDVRLKKSTGYGVTKSKPEYDDLVKIAREQNISIDEVKEILSKSEKENQL